MAFNIDAGRVLIGTALIIFAQSFAWYIEEGIITGGFFG